MSPGRWERGSRSVLKVVVLGVEFLRDHEVGEQDVFFQFQASRTLANPVGSGDGDQASGARGEVSGVMSSNTVSNCTPAMPSTME